MTDEVCEGCGVPLQSDDPNAPGFVPSHIARRSETVVCRRCYRISHYGKDEEGGRVDDENAWTVVYDVVGQADACVMVVDLVDFEGTFIPELVSGAGKLLVAANKVDLLPTKTPVEEVTEWVNRRFQETGLRPYGVYPISARSGYGVRVLLDSAKRAAGRQGKIGLVGATNVGKSTLMARWMKGTGEEGPTVSRFPGTTLGVVEREMGGGNLDIVDTPGLLTRGRMTDILCPECAARLVPEEPLSSKLIHMAPGSAVVIGGLAAVTLLSPERETIALAFASSGIPIQRVKRERIDRWLQGKLPSGETVTCSGCHRRVANDGWEQVVTDVDEMEDLAVHGLGWLSPRRSGLRVQVTVPAGVMVSTRPRLIGPKSTVAAGRSG